MADNRKVPPPPPGVKWADEPPPPEGVKWADEGTGEAPAQEAPKPPMFKPRPLVGATAINPNPGAYAPPSAPGASPSWWNEPEDTRPWAVRKGAGVLKNFVGGANVLAKGLGEFRANPPKWAQLAMASTDPSMALRLAGVKLPGQKEYEEKWKQEVKPALEENVRAYGSPTEAEQSLPGKMAGMIPMVTTAAIPGVGVPALAASFAGQGQSDIEEINKQRAARGEAPIPALGQEAYTLGQAGLAALPLGKPSSTFLGAAAKGSLTGAALNVLPAAARKYGFGTEENLLEAAKEGATTMGAFGLAHHTAGQMFAPRRAPVERIQSVTPGVTPLELEAKLPTLLEAKPEGMSVREVMKHTKADPREAQEVLNRLAADPEHPLERVVDAKGRVRYKLAATPEVKDALQVKGPATEVPRDGGQGGNLPEGGEGVRPGVQGEEAPREGKAQEEVVPVSQADLEKQLGKRPYPQSPVELFGKSHEELNGMLDSIHAYEREAAKRIFGDREVADKWAEAASNGSDFAMDRFDKYLRKRGIKLEPWQDDYLSGVGHQKELGASDIKDVIKAGVEYHPEILKEDPTSDVVKQLGNQFFLGKFKDNPTADPAGFIRFGNTYEELQRRGFTPEAIQKEIINNGLRLGLEPADVKFMVESAMKNLQDAGVSFTPKPKGTIGQKPTQEVPTKPEIHTALNPEAVSGLAKQHGFEGPHWDAEATQALDPAFVAEKRIEDFHNNPKAFHDLYASLPETEGGKIVGGDVVKMLVEHGLEPDASKGVSPNHDWMHSGLFSSLLKERLLDAPGDRVLLMSGGQGTGKTKTAQEIAKGTPEINTVIDTPGSHASDLEYMKKQAEAAGKEVGVVLVKRAPEEAVSGMLHRSEVESRAINPSNMVQTGLRAEKAVAEFGAANPDVKVHVVENTPEGAKITTYQGGDPELARMAQESDAQAGELTKRARAAYLQNREQGIGNENVLAGIDKDQGYERKAGPDVQLRQPEVPGVGEGGELPSPAPAEVPPVEPTQAEAPKSFTLGRGEKAREVELPTPEDQTRYQEATKAHDTRLEAIKNDPLLQGEDNRAARQKAYQDSGKQLASEKRSIEQAIQQREADAKAEAAPPQEVLQKRIKKAAADGEGGVAQSDAVILANRQRAARNASMDLMDHGVFNFAEWSRHMEEEFGKGELSKDWLHKVYVESLGRKMNDPRVIRSELSKPQTLQEGLDKAAEYMAPHYEGNGEVPKVSVETPLDAPAPMPKRDLGASEVKGLAKGVPPRTLLTGLLNFWKGGVFEMGHDPMTDSLIAETAASAGTHADHSWAADTFKGLESAKDLVASKNEPLVKEKLILDRDMLPYEAEAQEAAKSPDAKADFDASPRGQEYAALQERLNKVHAQAMQNATEMAKESPDVRIFLHASEKEGSPAQQQLEGMMGPAEIQMSNKLREYFQDRKEAMEARGLRVLEDPYVHWSGIQEMAPEEFQQLREAMAKNRGKEGQTVPLQDVMNFLSRKGNIPFQPSATASLASYIPSVNRRLATQPLLNRWNAAIDSNFNGKAPKLASYINDVIQSGMGPGSQHSEALSLIRNLTFLKTLWGNTGTAVKHGFKVPLTFADHGPMDFTRGLVGAGDAVLPEKLMDSPAVKKAMQQVSKLTGGLNEGERETAMRLAQTMGATKEINAALADIPWMNEVARNRSVLQKLNSMARRANDVGTTPVRVVEQMELGINVLSSLIRARDAGIGGEDAIRGAVHSVLANNFRGLWDTSPFLRTTQGQVLGMFTGTPTKIIGRYAEYALLPEAVDIYGTKNGVKLARSIMVLGALATAGKALNSDFLGKAIHTPFVSHDDQTGNWQLSFGPLAGGAEDLKFTPEAMKKFGLKQVPYAATKAARTYTGNIPPTYGGSTLRYWTGVPQADIQKGMQAKSAAKEAQKDRKSVERSELIKAMRKAGLM